ncbi:MAG: patatin-like phospholipase family protein [Hymenobacter sp.]
MKHAYRPATQPILCQRWLGLVLLLLLTAGLAWGQAPAQRPRVGLTLSGGGARGLAHIGLLKALDSAGVRVDYVTGTSMGAVVGSLYAAGYSGAEIEQVAHGLDWDALLTNAAQLSTITLPGKDDFGRYLLELPVVKGKLQFPNGVIESEELWLKLSELFLPYYRNQAILRASRGDFGAWRRTLFPASRKCCARAKSWRPSGRAWPFRRCSRLCSTRGTSWWMVGWCATSRCRR